MFLMATLRTADQVGWVELAYLLFWPSYFFQKDFHLFDVVL